VGEEGEYTLGETLIEGKEERKEEEERKGEYTLEET
jgi:hypothetical protein